MLNFNSGYLAPGVYVQAVSTPTPSIASLSADVICVVGPAQGWLTSTDVFMLSASVPKTLSQAGIVEASIVVTDATGAIQAADLYTIVQTGSGVSIVTTIELAAGSTMTTTQAYYITYQYTNLNYYTPQWFTSQQTLFNTFGQPFTAGGGIASPISLAGMLVLQRSSLVVIMPTTDTGGVATRTGLSGAYTAMEAIGGIDLIVPLPVGMPGTVGTPGDIANVASDLAAFCAAQSAAGMGNNVNGILGFETGVTVAPDTVAASTANQRVVLAWPNSYGYYNSQAQQTLNVGGYYVAATLAGILSSQPVNPQGDRWLRRYPEQCPDDNDAALQEPAQCGGGLCHRACPGNRCPVGPSWYDHRPDEHGHPGVFLGPVWGRHPPGVPEHLQPGWDHR
jgi:hypothetical protein